MYEEIGEEKRRNETNMVNQVHQYSLLLGSRRCGAVVLLHWCWLLLKFSAVHADDGLLMIVVNGVGDGLVCRCRRYVGDGLLTELHLLGVACREEADLGRSPNISLQKSAVS